MSIRLLPPLCAGLLLAGCATTRPPRPAAPPAAPAALTGIPACDAYLSTYIACHRAAGIFAPGQLQSRYEMMRDSLLRDSLDPDIRPQLANRCASLAGSLREALHGKSCDAPQPAGADGP